jgi:site-specific DNA-adenine methylase
MSEKIFVPPLKIQGIKTKLVPLIRENVILDKETIWYEPFMGSGVVGFNVEPERAVFADVNPHIINFYNRIKMALSPVEESVHFSKRKGRNLRMAMPIITMRFVTDSTSITNLWTFSF